MHLQHDAFEALLLPEKRNCFDRKAFEVLQRWDLHLSCVLCHSTDHPDLQIFKSKQSWRRVRRCPVSITSSLALRT